MNISQTKGWQNETKGLQLIEYSQRFCESRQQRFLRQSLSVPYLSILKMVRQCRGNELVIENNDNMVKGVAIASERKSALGV